MSFDMIEEGIPLIFLILAQDEASVLGSSLRAIKTQMAEHDQLHVVADRCIDRTADIAHQEGAAVHIRNDRDPKGKASALAWWVERQEFDPEQPIVILDADSVILPGFSDHVRSAMGSGAAGVQATLVASSQVDTPIGRLIALSERMDQGFFDRLRSRMGGSVRLRGTGMALRYGVLAQFAPMLQTKTEDVELTILLAAHGVKTIPAFEAKLLDPKPDIPTGAMNQRARWLQGQLDIVRRYPILILRLMFTNFPGFLLASSTLMKPRSLFSVLRLLFNAGILAAAIANHRSPAFIQLLIVGSLWINLPEFLALGY
ncbi:MAG: glycosyltransferase, partial [Anaerolineales bacterium]|nr:glycosyltransferase [Anaerolineales bacterium]